MSEQDRFNDIIREKLEKVEVPYEESHWSEMSQKLDQAGALPEPSGSSFLANKYFLAAAAGVAIISGWYLLSDPSENNTLDQPVEVVDHEKGVSGTNETPSQKASETKTNISEKASVEADPEPSVSVSSSENTKNQVSKPEEKVDKFTSYSEELRREESQKYVNKAVEQHKSQLGNVPKIDNPQLKTEIVLESANLCEDAEISFNIDRVIDGTTYYWDFGDMGLKSRKQNPTHVYKKPGVYNVILYVTKGEKNDYKAEKQITVGAAPEIEIVSVNNQITLSDPYAEFSVKSNVSCQYNWKFNESEKAGGSEVEFLIPEKGTYPVEATAVSDNGCATSESTVYSAQKGVKLYVEDAFRPNSNNGETSEFLPKELRESNVEFSFIVRNAQQQTVFTSNDRYHVWNGRLDNTGNLLPEDIYLWSLTFKDDKGVEHKQAGKIRLIH